MQRLKQLLILFAVLLCMQNNIHAQVQAPDSVIPLRGIGFSHMDKYKLIVVNGNPAIIWYSFALKCIFFMRATDADGSNWGPPVIAAPSITLPVEHYSVAVVNGLPCISYFDAFKGDLCFVRARDSNGNKWRPTVGVATEGVVGRFNSLVVLENGKPAIAYYDITKHAVCYIEANDENGNTWAAPVKIDANMGYCESINLIAKGMKAVIIYKVYGELRAATGNQQYWNAPIALMQSRNGESFYSISICNTTGSNLAISVFIDSLDSAKISYGLWDINTGIYNNLVKIDAPSQAISMDPLSRSISMSLTMTGQPRIAYMNRARDLCFSTFDNYTTTAPSPIVIEPDVSSYSNLCMLNSGVSAFAYYKYRNGVITLNYVRAKDVAGTSWNKPISFGVAK